MVGSQPNVVSGPDQPEHQVHCACGTTWTGGEPDTMTLAAAAERLCLMVPTDALEDAPTNAPPDGPRGALADAPPDT